MNRRKYSFEVPLFYFLLYCANHYLFFRNVSSDYLTHSEFSWIDSFFSAPPAFLDFAPHPYWVGILLFATRYGVIAGTWAGVYSAFLFLFDAWHFGARYQFADASFYVLPTFFILIGALVGLGIQRKDQRIKQLTRFTEKQEVTLDTLNESLETQTLINQELEKRIVSKMTTMVTLYQGAIKLESTDLNEILSTSLEFFCKTLEVDQASLYIKKDNQWQVAFRSGWEAENQWPTEYQNNQGLVGIAGSSDKILSIKDYIGSDLSLINGTSEGPANLNLKQECLIAAPLKDPNRNKVIAVFAVHSLPLLNLNSATMNLLSFLVGWSNRSIQRAFYFNDLKSQEILDPELQIYSYKYFESRLKQEFTKSVTYYLPLSVGLISLAGLSSLTPQQNKSIMLTISELLRSTCRDIDVIATYPGKDIQFCCLFSTIDGEKIDSLKSKILENFKKLNLNLEIDLIIGTSSFKPKTPSYDTLIENAQNNLRKRAA